MWMPLIIFVSLLSCSKLETKIEKYFKSKKTDTGNLSRPKSDADLGPSPASPDYAVKGILFLDQTKQLFHPATKFPIKGQHMASVDLNQDHYSDLVIIPSNQSYPRIFIYSPKGNYYEESSTLHFPDGTTMAYGLYYDFNGDDVVDCVAVSFSLNRQLTKVPLKLFEGSWIDGKLIFKENKKKMEKVRFMQSASVIPIDVDRDGRLDLYSANWFTENDRGVMTASPDLILMNTVDGFVPAPQKLNQEWEIIKNSNPVQYLRATPSLSARLCDLNHDGALDIFVTAGHRFGNKYWMNQSNGIFQDVAVKLGIDQDDQGSYKLNGGGNSYSALCDDFNDDGKSDLFVGEFVGPLDNAEVDRSALLIQPNGEFPQRFLRYDVLDLAINPAGPTQKYQAAKRAQRFDFDSDGKDELLVDMNGHYPYSRTWLWSRTTEPGVLENIAQFAGLDLVNSFSSLVGDFNFDGKQDWLTFQYDLRGNQERESLRLMANQNNLNDRIQLIIYLDAGIGNRTGVGAMINLKVKNTDEGNLRFHKIVEYSFGFLSPQNPPGLWLAWRDSLKRSVIDDLAIVWPKNDKLKTSPLRQVAIAKINDALLKHKKGDLSWMPLKIKINANYEVTVLEKNLP